MTKRVIFTFPPKLIKEPATYLLAKDYNLQFNILSAKVTPKEEGKLVMELKGEEKDMEAGLAFIESLGINVSILQKQIKWDEEECTNCGLCTAVCPSQAFHLDKETWKLKLDKENCILCELCVNACPVRVIEITI